jgi:hypothetical protein
MGVMTAQEGAGISPLDRAISVTFFQTFAASDKREERYTLRGLATRIGTVTAASKGQLPWLKLARFGDVRTDKNSLRHDSNVIAISGIEVDYDLGVMTVDEACDRLENAGVAAMVYTSPSHTEDAQRWRILCPVSAEMPGARRQHLVGRLNGLFNGVLAGESFTLSQSYYYGSVNHNPSHTVRLIDGTTIDEHDELDEIWVGKPHTSAAAPGQTERSGSVDLRGLMSDIINGASYHTATVRIAGLFARQRVPFMEARARLVEAMEEVPAADRDARWKARFADLDRTMEDIYGKEAAKLDAVVIPEPPTFPTDDPGYIASLEADFAMSAQDWADLEHRETGQKVHASPEATAAAGTDVLWKITEPWDITSIPMRPWIAKGYLMRRAVTVVSGPGSAGKSMLMVAWATALAVGCALHRMHADKPMRVATYNVEDDEFEQKRRFSGMLDGLQLKQDALGGRLAIIGPSRVGTLLYPARDGSLLLNTPVMDKLEEFVLEFKPDVLILDPFVELHSAEENDNTAVRAVMARFRAMAIQHNMSVVILHHSRKGAGTPGDPDSLRGASSIVGAARVALTLNVMTDEEADTFGLPKENRRDYFRLDGAKNNYAPIEDAEWFERKEKTLSNGSGSPGDGVAIAWPYKPKSALTQHTPQDLNAALDQIDAGLLGGVLFTATRRGASNDRWAGRVLMQTLGMTEGQATVLIALWVRNEVLVKATYFDSARREDRPGVRVNNSKRPS